MNQINFSCLKVARNKTLLKFYTQFRLPTDIRGYINFDWTRQDKF